MHKRTGAVLGLILTAAMTTASAQYCYDDIEATAPDSRYRDNGDGTVTDRVTNLIWKQCAEGLSGTACESGRALDLRWRDALDWAAEAQFAGSSRWRLPNIKELESLVEKQCNFPAINSRFFPNTPSSVFLSSSSFADDPYLAWFIEFYGGLVVMAPKKDYSGYVRLVRDGQ